MKETSSKKDFPEIMTIKQLGDYLQINPATLYKMARAGKIPCKKISGQWRFKKSVIDKWLEEEYKK